jgi:hypothetical protein
VISHEWGKELEVFMGKKTISVWIWNFLLFGHQIKSSN